MKSGRLLLLASMIPSGLCASPAPLSSPNLARKGVGEGRPTPDIALLELSENTALDARFWDTSQYKEGTQLGLRLFFRGATILGVGIGLWGIIDDCKALKEDGGKKNRAKCVGSVIATAATFVGYGQHIADFFIEFSKDVKVAAIEYTVNYAAEQWNRVRPGLPPFYRASAAAQNFQAPPTQRTKREENHIFSRAENHLTRFFSVEVRHIGIWDSSIEAPEAEGDSPQEIHKMQKREAGAELVPVFGLTINGTDLHLAYMGQDFESGGPRFKIGHGPGPATPENKQRLSKRDDFIPIYNGYYFANGGLDVIGKADPANSQEVSNNDFDFLHTYQQIECYLGLSDPRAPEHTSQMDAIGLWFQIYDNKNLDTVGGGIISPFSATSPSAITYMRVEGALEMDTTCTQQQHP